MNGLAIAQLEDVQPYVDRDQKLSLDCNTAMINQWINVGKNIPIEQMDIPVMDSDRNHAVIRVWLLHFGSKKVVKKPALGCDVSVESDATNVVVLQIHAYHCDQVFWKTLQEAPAKITLQTYFQSSDALPVHYVWSRRWSKNGKIGKPDDADQFSMLCRVAHDQASLWIKRSGTSNPPVFAAVKSERDGDGVTAHRVIWIAKDRHAALVKLASLPDNCGLVHRPPNSYGIRVEAGRFESAWKELREHDPIPSQIACKQKYLLAGAPPGLNGPKIEEWGKGAQWPLRVLRSYGGGKFLIGTQTEAPSNHMVIQNHPIICQPFAD